MEVKDFLAFLECKIFEANVVQILKQNISSRKLSVKTTA